MTYLEYCQSFLPPEVCQELLPNIDPAYAHRTNISRFDKAYVFSVTYHWHLCGEELRARAAGIYDNLREADWDRRNARNGTPLT